MPSTSHSAGRAHRYSGSAALCALLVAGLSGTAPAIAADHVEPPPRAVGAGSPADPDAPVPFAPYRPLTEGTLSFRPVTPKGWEQLNREVAPRLKTGQPPEKSK
ncbi:MAG TPA: hypothetical protein VNK52_01430 [Hyphomicrobiaceae bacterium]|nr:hypothetical protein [Hyphomicrobiaceae bacterium]